MTLHNTSLQVLGFECFLASCICIISLIIRYLCVEGCEIFTSCLDFHTSHVSHTFESCSNSLSENELCLDWWNQIHAVFFVCQLAASCVNSLQLKPQLKSCSNCTYIQQKFDSVPTVRCVSQKIAGLRQCGWRISSNQYIGFKKSINKHAIWIFAMIIIRVGEAKNPGPGLDANTLNIFHCNPTALVGKEHEIASWGSGITLVSETSATARAQRVIQCNLAKNKIKSIWSKPVTPYRQSSGEMRGIAGGTAIFSNFPARKTLEPLLLRPLYNLRLDIISSVLPCMEQFLDRDTMIHLASQIDCFPWLHKEL